MTDYVVGFAFVNDCVLLIHKKRPDWQKDFLTGVGGKLEKCELFIDAMIREFREESGLEILNWKLFCRYRHNDNKVFFYAAKISVKQFLQVRNMTDEKLSLIHCDYLYKFKTIENLKWLIPLAKYVLKNPENFFMSGVEERNPIIPK